MKGKRPPSGLAAIIIERLGKKGSPMPRGGSDDGGDSMMYEDAGKAVMSAMKSNDPAKLASALRDFVSMCMHSGDEYED